MSPQIPREAKRRLVQRPGVVAVGETTENGQLVARVILRRDSDLAPTDLPATLGGFPVTIEYGGPLTPDAPRLRSPLRQYGTYDTYRPIQPGASTGVDGTGRLLTFCFHLTDGNGKVRLLSNYHGWAKGPYGVDTRIMQPGVLGENVGTVDAVKHSLDAATATLDDDLMVDPKPTGMPAPTGSHSPSTGESVTKSGAVTGVSSGDVTLAGLIAKHPDGQIISDSFAASYNCDQGDSGSPVLGANDEAVGIHWGSFDDGTAVFADITGIEAWSGLRVMREGDSQNQPPIADFDWTVEGETADRDVPAGVSPRLVLLGAGVAAAGWMHTR